MTFFLIVPSVIVVSIILVHNVTNYVDLKIKYGALFMCAVLAFVSLFTAMEISPNPDQNFFVRLGGMILVSAALVTALNRFLVLREKADEENFTEEVRRAYKNAEEQTASGEIAKNRLKKVSAQVKESSAELESMDALVEYAKTAIEQGNVTAAIDAYQKVLDDYPADEYAPFVAIDLSVIYREQAAYTKAIKVYEEALTLAAVKKSPAVKAEFIKKLDYIKTVQSVLLRHRALSTPFSEIPSEYLQEIENEFNGNAVTRAKV